MSEALSQALRSLCNRTGWCYAVFWKLKRRSRMVLTWEDSYYEFASVPQASNAFGNANVASSGRSPLDVLLLKQDGGIAEDQIQLAVAKMSFHVYSLGEGIIGRVAFSGKHQWVFAAGERSIESGAPAALEHGWSNQFAAGIKTIAVVAVQQQGVVQLGSTQTMAEDLSLVGQIRGLFGALQSLPGALIPDFASEAQLGRCLSVAKSFPTYASKPGSALPTVGSLARTPMNSRTSSPVSLENTSVATKPLESGLQLPTSGWGSQGLMGFTSTDKPHLDKVTTGLQNPRTSHSFSRDSLSFQEETVFGSSFIGKPALVSPATLGCSSSIFASDASRASHCPGEHAYEQRDNGRMFDPIVWSLQDSNFAVRDLDQMLALPTSYGDEAGMMRSTSTSDEGFDYNTLFKAFQKDDLDDFNSLLASLNKEYGGGQANSTPSCSQFAFGDELSEIVGSLPKFGPNKEGLHVNMSIPSSEDTKPGKGTTALTAVGSVFDKSRDVFVSLSASKPEQLLDAVVAGASASQPCPSGPPNGHAKSPLGCPSAVAVGNAVQYLESQLSSSSNLERDIASNWAANGNNSSVDVSSSSWTEGSRARKSEENSFKDTTAPGGRKPEEQTRMAGRKRLRPGEAPRPRPKDRQQIQDRVRELRDIVPNATKCSIDALLEKTIRHMKFLQSVTQHGDKWKTGGDGKGERSADNIGLESGASWAMEFDGKGTGVPILVENLKQPRQMLVEMLCEERGLFWEIAENIRSLGLTILKGVMESRNDKIWARFNVEMHASKEVNRLKVVWNLTQLLKPSAKNTSGSAPSFSEVSDVCSESFGSRFQPQVSSHGITVSPGCGW